MRKGGKVRPWTVADERYLLEHAGRIPKREICRHLKRSGEAVTQKAKHMRKRGLAIDLRCHKSRLSPCPACGCLSGHMGRDGFCEPCRRRRQLAEIEARTAGLLRRLPPEERETYAVTEAETASRPDPMPRCPDTSGMSYYRRALAEERHALAMEEWAAANLRREIKAAQKRKERIQKKVKSMTP